MIDLKYKEIRVKYVLLKVWKKVILIYVMFKLSIYWYDLIKDFILLVEDLFYVEYY